MGAYNWYRIVLLGILWINLANKLIFGKGLHPPNGSSRDYLMICLSGWNGFFGFPRFPLKIQIPHPFPSMVSLHVRYSATKTSPKHGSIAGILLRSLVETLHIPIFLDMRMMMTLRPREIRVHWHFVHLNKNFIIPFRCCYHETIQF